MIHIYTGDGKGKTTAALGLALRASGAGLRVYIAQFIKGLNYSELKSIKYLRNIKLEQFGRGCFIYKNPKPKDILLAKEGLRRAKKIIQSRKFDLVILDEINVALELNLLDKDEVVSLLKKIPKRIELVLTGRGAVKKMIKLADYVTEMKNRKHPFKKKVFARRGIEF